MDESRNVSNAMDKLEQTETAQQRASDTETLVGILASLYRRRKLILTTAVVASVAAVVISLLLPKWYEAETRLLMPEASGSGALSGMVGDLSPIARSFLGGAGGDFNRYLSILTSRSAMESAVEEFDLINVYEVADSEYPMGAAIEILSDLSNFDIDMTYEYMSIAVQDQDPRRAADLANFFTAELNRRNAELSSLTAANYRAYVEERYIAAAARRDALLDSLASLQSQYGVLNIDAQTQLFFEQAGALRANAIEAEIQYEALRSQLGESNPTVQTYAEIVRVANRKYRNAINGQEDILPVAKDEVPTLLQRYASLELERTIEERILEVVGPMREQARFDELSSFEAVQVVDVAVPPHRKARPKRALFCIVFVLSVLILLLIYLFVVDWYRQHGSQLISKMVSASAEK